jgi:hypothetical protein
MADKNSEHPEQVFVVHGRNADAAASMFAFLRALGLRPIEWDEAVALTGKGSPYVGEVLDVAFKVGQAFVILLTPDDVAYMHADYATGESDPELDPKGQARPNVLFEAGMALGRSEDRTILVELGELRPFSDVGGRHVLRMDNTAQKRHALASRLETAGCPVNRKGSDWLEVGDFTPPKPGGGLPMGKRIQSGDKRGPHVDGAWHGNGVRRYDYLKITNNGAVPIHDVTFEMADSLRPVLSIYQDGPLARLPVGKSFTLRADAHNKTIGGPRAPDQFDLTVVGRLEDGSEFRQEIFIDLIG